MRPHCNLVQSNRLLKSKACIEIPCAMEEGIFGRGSRKLFEQQGKSELIRSTIRGSPRVNRRSQKRPIEHVVCGADTSKPHQELLSRRARPDRKRATITRTSVMGTDADEQFLRLARPIIPTCCNNLDVSCISAKQLTFNGGACAMLSSRKRRRKTAGRRVAPFIPMPKVLVLTGSEWQPFLELLPSRPRSEILRDRLNELLVTYLLS
jgi:hypothetical protein